MDCPFTAEMWSPTFSFPQRSAGLPSMTRPILWGITVERTPSFPVIKIPASDGWACHHYYLSIIIPSKSLPTDHTQRLFNVVVTTNLSLLMISTSWKPVLVFLESHWRYWPKKLYYDSDHCRAGWGWGHQPDRVKVQWMERDQSEQGRRGQESTSVTIPEGWPGIDSWLFLCWGRDGCSWWSTQGIHGALRALRISLYYWGWWFHMRPPDIPVKDLSSFSFFRFISVYKWFAYMYIYTPHVCLIPLEFRRGCQIPGNSRYIWLCGCWELNRDPLQEQQNHLNH